MNALEVIENITQNDNLINANLKYCLVTSEKFPTRYDGKSASPNNVNDFVDLPLLLSNDKLESFAGVGISIQASNITAIDVDHCFKEAFNVNSCDDRGKAVYDIFKDYAYIEFSFSGTGMRILFNSNIINDYKNKYYIKNTKNEIEFYQPVKDSFRYVTLTGKTIINNQIKIISEDILVSFLDKFMQRPQVINMDLKDFIVTETRPFEQLFGLLKHYYFNNMQFQNAWFDTKHYLVNGASNESETDFFIISSIYSNITKDKDMIKKLFEESPYFKSKDAAHKRKWDYNDYRYYNYIYTHLY